MDSTPVTARLLGRYFMIDGDELERSYKHHLSDYAEWEQRDHASNWMLIEDNLGENLSIDETMLQEDLVTILSTVASSTVPRICPTQRASSISTVTCPVKALVEATPISGPTWMYFPESVFLGIEAPTTLQMPYTKAPLLRANCMAATVPSGHTSFVTPYTSQRRSRMPQKEAG